MSASANHENQPYGGARLAIDLGPVLVFFLVNFLAPVEAGTKIYVATGAFMVAMVSAMVLSRLRFGGISPMLWFSGVSVVLLGGLTIWLHDETFIKMKPTVYYLLIAGILGFGLAIGRPMLKTVLASSFPGLNETGWAKLTRNYALFFVVMALVNELVWRNSSTDFWVAFKIWGVMPLMFGFTLANLPMLMRHGMSVKQVKDQDPGPIE